MIKFISSAVLFAALSLASFALQHEHWLVDQGTIKDIEGHVIARWYLYNDGCKETIYFPPPSL